MKYYEQFLSWLSTTFLCWAVRLASYKTIRIKVDDDDHDEVVAILLSKDDETEAEFAREVAAESAISQDLRSAEMIRDDERDVGSGRYCVECLAEIEVGERGSERGLCLGCEQVRLSSTIAEWEEYQRNYQDRY